LTGLEKVRHVKEPTMKVAASRALSAILFLLAAGAVHAQAPLDPRIDALLSDLPVAPASPAQVAERCDATLDLAGRARSALEARAGAATIDGDFAAFDALGLLVGDARGEASLVSETHVDAKVREAAEACVQRISDFWTAVSLSRSIYDRLAAIPVDGLDAATRFTLDKQLTAYRLAGVDRDAATRAKVTEIQQRITETGLEFAKNIRDDKGDLGFTPGELAGLPQDWLDARAPAADGLVHVSYDYPDMFPVLRFADRRETRRRMLVGGFNRGYPANRPVLERLLRQRYELARVLGYPDYATLVTADKMIGSPQRAAQFLDDANAAAQAGADADHAELEAFARTVDPDIDRMQLYDNWYLNNLLRKRKYEVDAAQVRRYFTYDKARNGIFELVRDLFGADIRPWDAPVWHESVSAWELYDDDGLVGRFYLDMHPREGKFNHAAAFPIRTGIEGRQAPLAALICNFPDSGPMEHGDVATFLHEFGHLVHMLYSGRTRYAAQSMGNLQWDFIEAPSQLLEEWVWDYETLKRFASDEEGEPIPAELVERMNVARNFGVALGQKQQLAFSAVSLNYYNRPPDFDLKAMFDAQQAKYLPFPPMEDVHFYAGFGHLDGYSAIYYTYVWSKAIALDLFTRFEAAGIRDRGVAMAYRRQVLEPGGSQDANTLIETFLGRSLSLDAYNEYLRKRPPE